MKHLFARFPVEMMNAVMSKYRFKAFESIPKDEEGFSYPKFNEIKFTLPAVCANEGGCILFADGLKILESMGDEAFNIHPTRWHKVKTYIANGVVEYPEMTTPFTIMDGRHRTLALMQIYPNTKIPVIVPHAIYQRVLEEGLHRNALVKPML